MSDLFSSNTDAVASQKKSEKPHHSGHRERLRERFLKGGADALPDYELLELILFPAIPRKDVKPLAKTLIERFKSFNGVFHASREKLLEVSGVSETTATAILTVRAAAFRMMQQDLMNTAILSNWDQLMSYCQMVMAHEKEEHFRVLFLNRKNHLIADEVQTRGTIDQAPAYPREIVKRALELGAAALILLHNHPSGDPTPSQADIDITKQIIEAAKPLEIIIHDHVVIAKSNTCSLRNEGYI